MGEQMTTPKTFSKTPGLARFLKFFSLIHLAVCILVALPRIASTQELPDLVMTSVAGPTTGQTGGQIAITHTSTTLAGGSPSYRVGLYLSTDSVITTSDTLLGYVTASGIAPGESRTGNTTVTIPVLSTSL
jgi:hypothetical protein